ncbi:MAG: class I tRNA ligase family protein, partial [Fenollaria timonensis]
FYMYLQTDGIDPKTLDVPYEKRSDIDKWILAKYNKLLLNIEEEMDKFELTNVVRMIQDFVVEDISNWYIRRSRRRFWATELDDDKKAVLQTTYEILLGVSKVIAPFAPYTAEEFYQRLGDLESVHIDYYPKANKDLIDEKLIYKMDLVRTLVKLGRSSRENAKIKVRIPLNEIVIDGKYREDLEDLTDLIKEELNVKNVYYEDDLKKYMNFNLKPNFKVAGSILGSKIKDFTKYLLNV